jgi:hypothetical protein
MVYWALCMWKISKSDIYSNIIWVLFVVSVTRLCLFKVEIWLWFMKRMMGYGLPILVAGIFAINEQFDKILLVKLCLQILLHLKWGVYSACYKLGLFMVLYRTAYTLGLNRSAILPTKCRRLMLPWLNILSSFALSFYCLWSPTCSTADDSRQLLLVAMKVVPLIIWPISSLGFTQIFGLV